MPTTFIYLRRKSDELISEKTDIKERIDSLVEGVNVARPWALHFNVLFMARRVYFSLLFAFP
jgi:hypothetical protein